MSFLESAGAGAAAGAAGAAGGANPLASGLGSIIGVDPSRISGIANNISGAMSKIAGAGGAPSGDDAGAPPLHNILQLIDPNVLRSIYAQIHGSGIPTGYAQ